MLYGGEEDESVHVANKKAVNAGKENAREMLSCQCVYKQNNQRRNKKKSTVGNVEPIL